MNGDMLAAGVELGDRYRFDVVHGHDWLVANACDHLAKRFDCPLVMTVHATEHGRHQGWVDKHPQSYIHGVERWMTNRADRVITCSHYMREHVLDVYGLDVAHVSVIPNGIDPKDLQPIEDLDTLRGRFAEPHEKLVLLVGRLDYYKGFQLALDAIAGVIDRLGETVSTRYLVAGSGPHEAELKRQAAELGIDDDGTFLGWIGDDVLHSLYRIADLCVVPSLYEPFGLVALEAMASGCPCVVADTGGLREVVPPDERVGLRFNGGDAEHLGVMIERLLTDDPLRERLVGEAMEHVLDFDWAAIARQTAWSTRTSSTPAPEPEGASRAAVGGRVDVTDGRNCPVLVLAATAAVRHHPRRGPAHPHRRLPRHPAALTSPDRLRCSPRPAGTRSWSTAPDPRATGHRQRVRRRFRRRRSRRSRTTDDRSTRSSWPVARVRAPRSRTRTCCDQSVRWRRGRAGSPGSVPEPSSWRGPDSSTAGVARPTGPGVTSLSRSFPAADGRSRIRSSCGTATSGPRRA